MEYFPSKGIGILKLSRALMAGDEIESSLAGDATEKGDVTLMSLEVFLTNWDFGATRHNTIESHLRGLPSSYKRREVFPGKYIRSPYPHATILAFSEPFGYIVQTTLQFRKLAE